MSVQNREALGKLNCSVRLVDGHYEVWMLWKHESPWLPNNRITAVARLCPLKRRLCTDEQLCCKYRNFMGDLLAKGYARKLTKDEAAARNPSSSNSSSNAAALHDGVSLNSQLNRGPDLTNSLLGLLLRFRQERIAFAADIQSIFLQVNVPAEDADALLFLWWEDADFREPPEEYQMVSHIFGAKRFSELCKLLP